MIPRKRIERLRSWRESDEPRRSLRGPTRLVAAVALALPLAAAPALAQGYDDDFGYGETDWSDDDWYDHDGDYGYGDGDWSYGYHYERDPIAQEWNREYGWYEDDYDYGSLQQRQQRQRQQQQAMRQRQQATFRGSLAGFQEVELEGQRDAHTLVRLRLEDGSTRVVDLGPNVSPSNLGLGQAERVVVCGHVGTIDGKKVLMASRVRVDGETTRIGGGPR